MIWSTNDAQALIRPSRPLYACEDLGLELDNTVYALDSIPAFIHLTEGKLHYANVLDLLLPTGFPC